MHNDIKQFCLSSPLGSDGIYRHTTLAFYVSTLSPVGPEIEVALGLSRLHYDSCLYFPLHMYSVLQTALLDVRMQPTGINWMCVCHVLLQGLVRCFVRQQSQLFFVKLLLLCNISRQKINPCAERKLSFSVFRLFVFTSVNGILSNK